MKDKKMQIIILVLAILGLVIYLVVSTIKRNEEKAKDEERIEQVNEQVKNAGEAAKKRFDESLNQHYGGDKVMQELNNINPNE